jgi:alpha-1,3-rhamnosyl/mannosyltransferase
MKVRIEISSLATPHQSGVSSYTRLLLDALQKDHENTVYAHYFSFMRRQPLPNISGTILSEETVSVPLRVYAKLQSFNIAPPFDLYLPKVDLTIFPNFATWPTSNSKLRATTIHDLTYLYYPEVVETKNLAHLRRVVPRSIKEADFILTVSESVKAELVKEFNIDPNQCVVTPIPPEDMFRKKCHEKELVDVRQKYSIGEKKYLLFLGNFEPRKNLKTLIQAYQLLPEEIRNEYQLVLAGGKGWKSEETQQALDAAVAGGADIKHIGYIDSADRPALYQAASVFVMPSIYEGFGIPVLEAMLSDCPVVAADIPVLREAGGDAALYADPTSPESFAKVITSAVTAYPYSTKDFILNVDRFSWQKNTEAISLKVDSLLK